MAGRCVKSSRPDGPAILKRSTHLYPVFRAMPYVWHSSVIVRSPLRTSATNFTLSFTIRHSFQGIGEFCPQTLAAESVVYFIRKSVTHHSGQFCYHSLRSIHLKRLSGAFWGRP